MEKGKRVLAAADDHAPWIKAIAAEARRDLSSGWTRSPSMEKSQADKGKQAAAGEEEDHAPWIKAIAAQQCRDLSSGCTRSPSMEKAEADQGKHVAAADEEEDHAPWLAAIEAQERRDGSAASYGRAVPNAVQPKRKLLTDAQIRRKKKKNKKTREREVRKAKGEKIWSPADVVTFDESDSDDMNEVNINAGFELEGFELVNINAMPDA